MSDEGSGRVVPFRNFTDRVVVVLLDSVRRTFADASASDPERQMPLELHLQIQLELRLEASLNLPDLTDREKSQIQVLRSLVIDFARS